MLPPSSLRYAPCAVSSACCFAAIVTDLVMLASVISLSAVILVSSDWLWLLTLPLAACSLMPVSWFGLALLLALP
jgi:hypothetical protein